MDGQWLEAQLDHRQPAQTFGAHGTLVSDEDTEVQFRQGRCADGQLPLEPPDACRHDHARVEDRLHLWRSRTRSSNKLRSVAHAGSEGPVKSSAISSKLRHGCRSTTGTRRTAGLPLTVTVTTSPASARRTSSLARWRSSLSPMASIAAMVAHVITRGAGQLVRYPSSRMRPRPATADPEVSSPGQ